MIGWIRRNNDICIFLIFAHDLYFVQFYTFAFEVHEIDTVMVSRGIIELVKGRPGVARVFHLVGIDRAVRIAKASLCQFDGSGVGDFDGVATGLGGGFRPVQV